MDEIQILKEIKNNGGFITHESQIQFLMANHKESYRLKKVLVRCGGCRFTCGLQDFKHISEALERAGDYVRDISTINW